MGQGDLSSDRKRISREATAQRWATGVEYRGGHKVGRSIRLASVVQHSRKAPVARRVTPEQCGPDATIGLSGPVAQSG